MAARPTLRHRVTVNSPPAISVPSTSMSEEEEFKARVQQIFFDYDTYDIRGDAQATLSKDADYLMRIRTSRS